MYLSCRFFKKPFTLLWNILYWSSFLKCNLLSFSLKPFIFWEVANPYKICWKTFSRNTFLPSKHLLVFSVTIFRLLRRLEDVLQIRLEDLLKTSWKTKNCYAEHVLKTSWRSLGDKQNVYWEYLYLTNLNLYLINLYLTYLYLTNQGESKMH